MSIARYVNVRVMNNSTKIQLISKSSPKCFIHPKPLTNINHPLPAMLSWSNVKEELTLKSFITDALTRAGPAGAAEPVQTPYSKSYLARGRGADEDPHGLEDQHQDHWLRGRRIEHHRPALRVEHQGCRPLRGQHRRPTPAGDPGAQEDPVGPEEHPRIGRRSIAAGGRRGGQGSGGRAAKGAPGSGHRIRHRRTGRRHRDRFRTVRRISWPRTWVRSRSRSSPHRSRPRARSGRRTPNGAWKGCARSPTPSSSSRTTS